LQGRRIKRGVHALSLCFDRAIVRPSGAFRGFTPEFESEGIPTYFVDIIIDFQCYLWRRYQIALDAPWKRRDCVDPDHNLDSLIRDVLPSDRARSFGTTQSITMLH
jgi:hypothetical protein